MISKLSLVINNLYFIVFLGYVCCGYFGHSALRSVFLFTQLLVTSLLLK